MACHKSTKQKDFVDAETDSLVQGQKAMLGFEQIHQVKNKVASGDLIVRTGKDFTSIVIQKLSQKDKTYSHCGIASWENDTLFVYHALGGEWNPDQKLRRDPFELFCNPYENKGFGIFRYRINDLQQKNIIDRVHQLFKQGIKFDMHFDLATDDRMYCSEFVYKSIEKATQGSIAIGTTTLNHIKFIAVDNLFLNPYCNEIKRTVF